MSFTWEELDRMRPDGDWRLPLPPTCRRCAYILTGVPSRRCPECGTPINWREVRHRSARIWSVMNRLKHANHDATQGLYFGLVGWGVLLLFCTWGPAWMRVIMRLLSLLFAMTALILGSQMLNIRRVPAWARPFMRSSPPDMLRGAGAMVLGATLLTGILLIW